MEGDSSRVIELENELQRLRGRLAELEATLPASSPVLPEITNGFHLMFASNPLPMWVVDRHTFEFLTVNDAAVARYGYSRDEFLRMHLGDIVVAEGFAEVAQRLTAGAAGLQTPGERRHRCRDGREIVVDVSAHSFDLVNRSVSLVVVRDITAQRHAEHQLRELNNLLEERVRRRTTALQATAERLEREAAGRRRVEAALRLSEAQFRSLAECAPIGIFLTDVQGRCQYTNARWQQIAGLDLDASLGDGWASSIHPDDRELVFAEWTRTVGAGIEFSLQFRFQRPNGEVRWVHARAAAQRAGSGEIVGYVGTDEDITERRAVEAALRASEQQFQQIADNIDQVLWLATLGEKVQLYVSPAYEVIWGRSRESLYASPHSWVEAIHPDERRRVDEIHARHRRGVAAEMEYRVVRPDGTIRWVHDRGFPIVDADGTVGRIAGIAEDVTGRKGLAARLQQAQLTEARLEGVTLTARELAHRINNALAPLSLTIELLQAQPDASPTTRELLQSAAQVIVDTAEDIDKLQRVVRVETWQTPIGPSLDLDRSSQQLVR